MQNILKPLLAILGLVLLGALVWYFFIRGGIEGQVEKTTGTGVPITNTSAQNIAIQADVERFQKLLNELKQVNLSQSVFTQPQYPSMQNYTEQARQRLDELKANGDVLGRDNPFSGLEPLPGLVLQASPVTPTQPRTTPRR